MSAVKSKLMDEQPVKFIETGALRIAYLEYGPGNGWPVILSHGFPYDAHAFDEVALILAQAGSRVIVPYTRGFGPTQFISPHTMRNGQQAARGADIIQLSDALGLVGPILGGFDWGGNASCVAAALWPEKVAGLVSYASYDVIDIEQQKHTFAPSLERVCWYQHLFQSERGRECLTEHRYEIGRMLWNEWSPGWQFDEALYARTAAAFENPDFVDVVIHCYRFMHGLEPGEPTLQPLEDLLAQKPKIKAPTVTIDGAKDPLKPGGTSDHSGLFVGLHEHIVVDTGHNVPQELPGVFADAIIKVHGWLC
ncbi:Pimeloyl-ACP methyl ester carboxylesterase [Chitinophaga rupis]|uniref:Pimeloyl-ACP methyl ester carboxylesterase n=1 Tax=Chitinophaga rupis TaxID=573321 RepID=A0A1H7R949_9BACT|nr:alpha/beta hydrolase [Chitinophaga rupis]SEL56662.1 Pimeloyl-ACP methyl ester carboxylesterase [Chitinophaga rupis]